MFSRIATLPQDKSIIEVESEDKKSFTVTTLYKEIRSLEARGHTEIGLSYATVQRPENRQPGQPDKLNITLRASMDFMLTEREAEAARTAKTIFSFKVTRKTFPTAALAAAYRFQHEHCFSHNC